MKSQSKLSRAILVSPWFPLVFLVIPIVVILSIRFQIRLPMVGTKLLLFNNISFALLVTVRLLRCIGGLGKPIRYGADSGRPRDAADLSVPASEIRSALSRAGYVFTDAGDYGEKRNLAYVGTTILYCGIFVLLATGIWDNMRQFAGAVLDGVGPATDLNRSESYRNITLGPLTGKPQSLPRMQIVSQRLPDAMYPKGSTDVILIPEDGKGMRTTLVPTDPVRIGPYDIYMSKLTFEAEIVIKSKADQRTIFDDFVKLDPLVEKRGPFGFYGPFVGAEVVGGAYYQPEKSLLKVVITQGGKREVADMAFQVDQQATTGDYILSCAKMGQWSEIHVVRRRHKALLWLGGIATLIGLALRLTVRPQRVWIEETDGGSRVAAVGKEAKKLTMAES